MNVPIAWQNEVSDSTWRTVATTVFSLVSSYSGPGGLVEGGGLRPFGVPLPVRGAVHLS